MKYTKHELFSPIVKENDLNEKVLTYVYQTEIEGVLCFAARTPYSTDGIHVVNCNWTFTTRTPIVKDDVIDAKYKVEYVVALHGFYYAYLVEVDQHGRIEY